MSATPDLSFKDVSALRCPETRQSLELMGGEQLESLNDAIRAGDLQADGGGDIERPFDAGLVREDGRFIYPVRDGVPNLLLADRIDISDL